jgi:hypothetical protein
MDQLTSFLTNYNALRWRRFKVLRTQSAEAAVELIKERSGQSEGRLM